MYCVTFFLFVFLWNSVLQWTHLVIIVAFLAFTYLSRSLQNSLSFPKVLSSPSTSYGSSRGHYVVSVQCRTGAYTDCFSNWSIWFSACAKLQILTGARLRAAPWVCTSQNFLLGQVEIRHFDDTRHERRVNYKSSFRVYHNMWGIWKGFKTILMYRGRKNTSATGDPALVNDLNSIHTHCMVSNLSQW